MIVWQMLKFQTTANVKMIRVNNTTKVARAFIKEKNEQKCQKWG
jgi:hypothetical protein